MSTVRVAAQVWIQLPAELLARQGWSPGMELEVLEGQGALLLRPVAPGSAAAVEGLSEAPATPPVQQAGAPAAPEAVPTTPLALRLHLGLNRSDFARLVGVQPTTVAGWEEGSATPDTAAQAGLVALAADPEAALARLPSLR